MDLDGKVFLQLHTEQQFAAWFAIVHPVAIVLLRTATRRQIYTEHHEIAQLFENLQIDV